MWVQKLIEAAKQSRSPQQLDEEVLAKIEGELGLEKPNETVRSRLADLVFEYNGPCSGSGPNHILRPPGRPFTVDGFGQWLREAITAAGLPLDCNRTVSTRPQEGVSLKPDAARMRSCLY
jgi:hypothetical protein